MTTPGSAARCSHCGYRNDLAEEVADTRHAVLRLLDIIEDDKRRSMRVWGAFVGLLVGLFLLAVL